MTGKLVSQGLLEISAGSLDNGAGGVLNSAKGWLLAKSIRRRATPPVVMNAPESRKNGIASRV